MPLTNRKPRALKIASFFTPWNDKKGKRPISSTPVISRISNATLLCLKSSRVKKEAKKPEIENASINKAVVGNGHLIDRGHYPPSRLPSIQAFQGYRRMLSVKVYDKLVSMLIAEVTRG